MEFVEFNEMTHSEILEVLLDHYNELIDRAEKNKCELMVDSRSMALKNRGREINSALVAITDLLDDLSIDVDEL